jgi:hypothetical protein
MVKTGIMSGYKDENGNLTGLFGPADNVSLAQLAKIAHKLAGIDETKTTMSPQNIRARNTWFSQYYASAEARGWLAFRNTRTDPEQLATRAEVVSTILQALDIPRIWPKGIMFTDVQIETPYSSSIETAATAELVSGNADADGTPLGTFSPDNPINRAELAKILSTAMDLFITTSPEFTGESY